MFREFDQSLMRQHNEGLMHEAREWHLQRSLRANREQSLGTRPRVESSRTSTGVVEMEQGPAALTKLQLTKERAAWGMKALALSLLGQRRSS
jgi:hypothetical protein